MGAKILTVVFSLSCILACSPYKSVTPTLNQDGLPPECDGLIALVKRDWKQHKKFKYFEYNKNFITSIQMDYHECMLQKFTKEDIVQLLGEPNEGGRSALIYHLGELCIRPSNDGCKLLTWAFDRESGLLVTFHVQKVESQ